MGKKSKSKIKREKKTKTKEERVNETKVILEKLSELGLSKEFDGIKEFNEIVEKYVEEGISWSGEIKLNGLKRILEARLPMRQNIKCWVNLKYDQNV